MLRSNAAGTYIWFSIHDTHLSDKRVGGWDRKRGHRGTPRIVHKRRARRARNGTQMVLASRCVYSAAFWQHCFVTATCPLSHLSGLSCQSSGDSGGGELGGDSRCTITWQNLRFGSPNNRGSSHHHSSLHLYRNSTEGGVGRESSRLWALRLRRCGTDLVLLIRHWISTGYLRRHVAT